jgi:hypothetical protein
MISSKRVLLVEHKNVIQHSTTATTTTTTKVLVPTVSLALRLLHISQLRSSASCTTTLLVTRDSFMLYDLSMAASFGW